MRGLEMKDEKEVAVASRRNFFRLGLLGGTAAGALAVVDRTAQADAAAGGKRAAGYRETEHVKKVYALARF